MAKRSDDDLHRAFGIRAVARLTGLSDHALRVWEQRYGAVDVARSPAGRRLYREADVQRLCLLKQLVDHGERIGQVARLDQAALEERLETHRRSTVRPLPVPERIAVCGEMLGARLRATGLAGPAPCHVATLDELAAALTGCRIDAALIEVPCVDAATVMAVRALRERVPAIAVLYAFARRADLDALQAVARVVRPLPGELTEILASLANPPRRPAPQPMAPGNPARREDAPPPHFSPGQLASLAARRDRVECECPAHLAQLVASLNAFETYSRGCASRSPDDAALHAQIATTTARARALLEQALARVAEVEGIVY